MAATAAVSISCFYSCTSRRHLLSIPVIKFTGPRFPFSSPVCHFTDQLSVAYVENRRNLLKITAAMTQGEVETETEVAQAEAMARLQNTKLYFGNIPYNCDSEQLAGVIQQHASPEMIEVLYDKETGRSRGFAVVTMSSIQDCEAVISNLNGFEYDGRTLRVKFSDKSKPRVALYVESEFKLFVGNLCWSVTSEALKQVFKDYGNLVSARVIYDGESGRSRGFGFVCFSTKEEMDSAMESLNGLELEGRALRISLALGKKT
ncbi:28 kDa ribonucleoprotein, chloroplastic [Dendrobium catenatum]|uniref:29 kDa ribonucleoprotein B, chloroplastic n=1 Tax=Dendrobium catenatum TaxID=906689 RepID=A0A2I0VUQ8_9ASPA|nr:28 kDa ribonucleoprotein, chloroplastic [Dendrobium catenatum]PKU67141.1 29 kDa ribonucleoprotein B, chloroplastic [Dendrobium catenatum]